MIQEPPPPLVADHRLPEDDLAERVRYFYGDKVKFVVDVERGRVAVGGDAHVDLQRVLVDTGSDPSRVWGASYFPGRSRAECVEFKSQINARPDQGNPGLEIVDPAVRDRIRSITFELMGEGEHN
jgi:hypothetical protein